MRVLPEQLVETLHRAWEEIVTAASAAGVDLQLGVPTASDTA